MVMEIDLQQMAQEDTPLSYGHLPCKGRNDHYVSNKYSKFVLIIFSSKNTYSS